MQTICDVTKMRRHHISFRATARHPFCVTLFILIIFVCVTFILITVLSEGRGGNLCDYIDLPHQSSTECVIQRETGGGTA